jgi:hypothetical protein
MTLSLSDTVKPAHPSLAWRVVGDEVILVDPTQQETVVRVLNGVGGAIWLQLDGTRDLAAVARTVAETYDAPLIAIQEDVLVFVETLLAKGVLTLV